MEEDAKDGYQGKQYRAQSSRASDYHDDGLEMSWEKDEADPPLGDSRPYRAQGSRASDIHPDGLPDAFKWPLRETLDSEEVDSEEGDYEEVSATITQ